MNRFLVAFIGLATLLAGLAGESVSPHLVTLAALVVGLLMCGLEAVQKPVTLASGYTVRNMTRAQYAGFRVKVRALDLLAAMVQAADHFCRAVRRFALKLQQAPNHLARVVRVVSGEGRDDQRPQGKPRGKAGRAECVEHDGGSEGGKK